MLPLCAPRDTRVFILMVLYNVRYKNDFLCSYQALLISVCQTRSDTGRRWERPMLPVKANVSMNE